MDSKGFYGVLEKFKKERCEAKFLEGHLNELSLLIGLNKSGSFINYLMGRYIYQSDGQMYLSIWGSDIFIYLMVRWKILSKMLNVRKDAAWHPLGLITMCFYLLEISLTYLQYAIFRRSVWDALRFWTLWRSVSLSGIFSVEVKFSQTIPSLMLVPTDIFLKRECKTYFWLSDTQCVISYGD